MTTIQSDTVSAQEAIHQLTGINPSSFTNQVIASSTSNITAMKNGQAINNQLMNDVSNFAQAFLKQANKFPALAERIEAYDRKDAQAWEKS